MLMPIDKFRGPYRWLSNFWPCSIRVDGYTYDSVEYAYIASKTLNTSRRALIRSLRPDIIKSYGHTLDLRPGWDSMRIQVMSDLLRQKFRPGSELAHKLLLTDGHELIEGNTWNDRFWGVCRGEGGNHLGKILMQIRDELKCLV